MEMNVKLVGVDILVDFELLIFMLVVFMFVLVVLLIIHVSRVDRLVVILFVDVLLVVELLETVVVGDTVLFFVVVGSVSLPLLSTVSGQRGGNCGATNEHVFVDELLVRFALLVVNHLDLWAVERDH